MPHFVGIQADPLTRGADLLELELPEPDLSIYDHKTTTGDDDDQKK